MRKPDKAEKLYIDFDSFFASVEQHLNPELRGKPIGVIPLDSEHSGCIAASYEAKKFGVKTGTPMKEARVLCPGIRFVVARHDIYVRLHHRIVEAVENCVPVSGTRSIDEVVCHLLLSEINDAAGLAARIKQRIHDDIGQGLSCSIGIAPTELLAKIAAEMDKPNGFVMFNPNDLPGRLLELELRDLPGVAKGIEHRLNKAGIKSVAQLWALQAKHMRAIWGNVEGERFWAALHGYEVIREETKRRMFGHGRILPREWRSPSGRFHLRSDVDD
ncbi:DNA polymerase IV [Nymphon striatum]|nr:DNA polymerase IV [Nymphon striatum]